MRRGAENSGGAGSSPVAKAQAKGRDRINTEAVNLSVSTYKRAAYLAIRDLIVELEIPLARVWSRTTWPPD